MNKWYQIFHRNTGLSPYVWVVFCILPFYFIFRSSSTPEVVSGIVMIVLFFVCYRLSFVSKGWLIYFWTSVQIVISIAMTVNFSYVYFSIFLAFFIGNIQSRAGFFTLYAIHLTSTFVTVNYGFATKNELFFTQFPFILISLIVVILLPFNTYNQKKQGELEDQLEDANKRISELVKLEERQRIARDLHDTIGQKLSLIGLKSDLASKLIHKNPDKAQSEILDVQQTARTALKEVREMVTNMRGIRLDDEMHRVVQILGVAEMELTIEGDPKLTNTTLLTENVLSMCLKEAVTNVVRHSRAKKCCIAISSTSSELTLSVRDDGVGMNVSPGYYRGNGLRGMKERLEFVNGSLEILSESGTEMIIKVPHVVMKPVKEMSE
ncbi:sensor histidine kinase [Paenibacillus sp. GSMTC-2017]|uniref:sensor histidine kinase n=1 Tax=Paenibacillus sp. GSMTC-2017 TaxID=2794350 RepID=UPI0018D666C4|nr:sensor histidine kinase [Paenibacillus sp. GSMTC-2017]MBH5319988.1 sensor histidine kinase [Paenibacillus sp. GSMTC-2017]